MLRQFQPSADHAIQQTIRHLQSVESLYDELLQPLRRQLVKQQPDGTVWVSLQIPSQENQTQLLYELIRPYGFNYATAQDILSASQSGRHFYSSTHHALLDRQHLEIEPLDGVDPIPIPQFRADETQDFDFHTLDWKALPANMALFDADKVVRPLALRHWREGDRFQPLGMPRGTQLLSDFFTDHKYSLTSKQRQLLLVDATDSILWIVGRRTAHPFRVTPATRRLLSVSLEEEDCQIRS